jgi:cytochrome c oxidase subunit 1
MWGGRISFEAPMLFILGFFVVFLIGGLSGPMLAAVPFDWAVHDTYFVVAHMHYVIFGTAGLALFAAVYFWFPKITGWRLNEQIARWHFWLLFIGFNVTFFPQHLLGLRGMPRRYWDYPEASNFEWLHLVSTVGVALQALGIALFVVNVLGYRRFGTPAGDNPWDANSLEWATTSPPPPHNFDALPPIRSERPTFDMNHPGTTPPQEVEA